MADPTRIADIIVPDVFAPYFVEQIVEKSALVQSGIVVPDDELDKLAASGGTLINMPFFKDLTGDDEVLSESNPLDPDKITSGKDVARLHTRGKAWGVSDLAKALSGADPMGAIGDLVADFWNKREQAILIATLGGVFADNIANDGSDLVSDVAIEAGSSATDANLIGANAIVDAAFKLGDAAEKLTAICMHSGPYSRLVKLDLIDYQPDSQGKMTIPYYMGKRVIVDDTCPVVAGGTSGYKYTTYLFGQGAVGRGEGGAPVPVETDRDSLQGEDYLITRRHFILHVRGIKYLELTGGSAIAGLSPSNTELAQATRWDRVYQKKNIRVVKLVTNG